VNQRIDHDVFRPNLSRDVVADALRTLHETPDQALTPVNRTLKHFTRASGIDSRLTVRDYSLYASPWSTMRANRARQLELDTLSRQQRDLDRSFSAPFSADDKDFFQKVLFQHHSLEWSGPRHYLGLSTLSAKALQYLSVVAIKKEPEFVLAMARRTVDFMKETGSAPGIHPGAAFWMLEEMVENASYAQVDLAVFTKLFALFKQGSKLVAGKAFMGEPSSQDVELHMLRRYREASPSEQAMVRSILGAEPSALGLRHKLPSKWDPIDRFWSWKDPAPRYSEPGVEQIPAAR
jgi:hypothetical protein